MKNKKFWLGMLVMTSICVFLYGCEIPEDTGYTFEFKVDNISGGAYATTIDKIEFINGSNENAPILQTEILNLSTSQMSNVYIVSGFTEKDGNNKRIYGVRVTYTSITTSNTYTSFMYKSASNKAKIIVQCSPIGTMRITDGNW